MLLMKYCAEKISDQGTFYCLIYQMAWNRGAQTVVHVPLVVCELDVPSSHFKTILKKVVLELIKSESFGIKVHLSTSRPLERSNHKRVCSQTDMKK